MRIDCKIGGWWYCLIWFGIMKFGSMNVEGCDAKREWDWNGTFCYGNNLDWEPPLLCEILFLLSDLRDQLLYRDRTIEQVVKESRSLPWRMGWGKGWSMANSGRIGILIGILPLSGSLHLIALSTLTSCSLFLCLLFLSCFFRRLWVNLISMSLVRYRNLHLGYISHILPFSRKGFIFSSSGYFLGR